MLRFAWLTLVLTMTSPAFAAEGPDYGKDIKPILQRRCYSCHGALKQKGGLRLDAISAILKGGDTGPAVEPGKSAESLILDAVLGKEGLQRMPVEGEPLNAEEVAKLTEWINAGAHAPDEPLPGDPRQHWSFQRPTRPALPAVTQPEWQQNPIDAFISAEHLQRGLTPRPEAPRNVLLRRVYLDLTGLPPTRKEVQEFQQDTSPDAYEKVVDRLLASPQYGERWARHWMDVWRYSDWDGYGAEIRESQAHIWRWRDWIVESLNSDKGYDRMIQEMLAADELAPEDSGSLRATGFLVRNYFRFNRHIWMDNTVEHTSKAFLGMTVNCARCHDHMYDPIEQREYYQLRAIFEPYDVRTDRLASQPDVTKDGLARVYDAHHGTQTFLFVRGDDKQPVKDKPLPPATPAALGGAEIKTEALPLPVGAYYPGLQRVYHDEALADAEAEFKKGDGTLTKAAETLAGARQRLVDFQAKPADPAAKPTSVLSDDFAVAKPELWKSGRGRWEYQGGHLRQLEPTDENAELVAQTQVPRDFYAQFRFKITGGKMWKSVGLTFDGRDEQNDVGVYLSATAGGPKVQLFTRTNGQHTYPGEAMQALPIAVGDEHVLQVFARDQLVNVAVDGKLAFAYKLPQSRAMNGQFKLWTFDATAEFISIQVEALGEAALVEKVTGDQHLPIPQPPSLETLTVAVQAAEQSHKLAEATRATAEASRLAVAARVAADVATYSQPAAPNAGEVAQAAVRMERELALKQAEQNQLQQEFAVQGAKAKLKPEDEKSKAAVTEAEAKLADTTKALDAAKAAISQPLTADYKRFGTVYPTTSTGRRLAFARWITANENPLTARVAINHLWLRHFGSPLVPSVFDFGLNGKAPTHPALLDWLAMELMQNGWRTKAIHRLMVTSRAYRTMSHAAGIDDPNLRLDPENVYLWRANSRRMEAEVIRDSTLSVCEQLDRTLGGPDLDPATGLTVARRSLYFRSAKEKKVTFLAMFDSPNVVECYRRSESIVPQQALAMTNSPLTQAQARLLTKRLTEEVGADATPENTAKFIAVAFEQILARPVSPHETQECVSFLNAQTQRFATAKELTTFNGGVDTHVPPSPIPHLRARENLVHVLLNHNDFVTIR